MTRTAQQNRVEQRSRAAVRLLLVLFAIAVAGSGLATAEDASPANPTNATPPSLDDLLTRLNLIAPEDDPAAHIELAREVLRQIKDTGDSLTVAEVRCGLGRAYRLAEKYGEAVSELEIAADLARRTEHHELMVSALADLARAHFRLGDFEASLAACRSALSVPQIADDPDRSWTFQNIIAATLLQKGDFDAAIETSSVALEERQRVGDLHASAILLNNIGVAHMYLGDWEPALTFFQRARALRIELGQTKGVADILSNIGDIKHFQGHSEEAIEIHLEALRLREEEGSDYRIALSHRSLAAALLEAGRTSESIKHVDVALERMRRLGAEPEILACLAIKAEALAETGQGQRAVAAATEGLDLARKLGMRGREATALDAMVVAQIAVGNPSAAIEFQTEARRIENELATAETRRKFAAFQAEFEAREKAREIELLTKNNEIQALELANQRLWRNSLAAGLVLLALIAAAGWHRFLSKRQETRERAQADAALLQSMERYRLLFERNLAGIFQTDRLGRIQTSNTAFASMLGHIDTDELNGLMLERLASDPAEIRRFLVDLEIQHEIPNRELVLHDKNGEPISILMNARLVADSDGEGRIIEIIAVDLSDQKRAEEDRRRIEIDVQQSKKLESLGVLAGGIAHDFNNMLMAILSNISLAKRSVADDEGVLRRLNEAEEACLRATGLTQQLLTFSKGGRPIRRTTTIGQLVEEASTYIARGSNCSIDCRTASDLWPAEIDEGQMAQVIQNLVLNSMEAMPLGGIITVTTANAHLGEGDVPALEPGRFVRVEVNDTGGGIPEGDLDRVFDPFFTTKKGQTGLGLATVFSIIRSHGGAIVAHSEEDRGSRFSVYIPASEESGVDSGLSRTDAITGQGRLLIMDDDEAVRTAAAELLETIGYAVATAADGAEAVDLYSEAMAAGRRFDAVVLDLTVPGGVGGRETMTRLLELDPEVKAIVSSGYSTDPVMANYREHGFSGVAVKPYRLAELARTLDGLIEP